MKKIIISLVAALMICQPVFATIPNEDILDYFDNNGIYYYNPDGNNDECNSSSTTLAGSDIPEKIWNYFIEKGFTDAQAAGILGNGMAETGLEPTRASNSTYWGLFQWSYGRKDGLFTKLTEAGLEKYTSSEYWPSGASEKIPESDLDQILKIELDYTLDDDYLDWQEELKKQTEPEAAAEVFLTLFERAVGGTDEILYYAPFVGIKYQATKKRREYAREYFDKYSGKGTVTSGATNSVEKGKNVSIIGDSITVGSTIQILEKFTDLSSEDIDAKNGRSWNEGIDIAKNMNLKNNVIFALGTNTKNLTDDQINDALTTIGTDKNIIFVTNYDKNDESAYDTNNEKFISFAKNNSNIIVADWKTTVSKSADTYMSDNVHPNSSGSTLFAETLYDAINSNTNENGCSVSGEFTSLVKAYAWPEYHKAPFTNRMPDYADAVTTSISEGRYVGGSVNGVPGIDCGGFVTILTQNSGLASDYNDTKGDTDTQEAWVKSHNWTLLNSNTSTAVDTSILQAGDVAFTNGHTFIYVGEIDGFDSNIASASYGNSSARAPMAGHESLISGNGSIVRWYRKPNYSTNDGTSLKTNIENTVYDKK